MCKALRKVLRISKHSVSDDDGVLHVQSFSRVWLCNCMDCSLLGSSVHGDSSGKNTGVGCHVLLQGILLTQGLNPCLLCLLHWQADSLPLSYLGSLMMMGVVIKKGVIKRKLCIYKEKSRKEQMHKIE